MKNSLELAELLNTKLCHDLSGSLGVVDNCINLIDHEDASIAQQSKELVSEGAQNLINLVKSHKIAFAPINDIQALSLAALKKRMEDLFNNSKVKLEFSEYKNDIDVRPELVKIMICLGIFTLEKMHNSGAIDVSVNSNEEAIFNLSDNDRRLSSIAISLQELDPKLNMDINVKNCYLYYINQLCDSFSYKISVQKNSESIELKIFKK